MYYEILLEYATETNKQTKQSKLELPSNHDEKTKYLQQPELQDLVGQTARVQKHHKKQTTFYKY